MGVIAAFHPQVLLAEGFTGEDFGNWEQPAQDSYIQISITMATIIAAQAEGGTSQCLDTWYTAGTQTASRRNDAIRASIAQYPDFHPSGVILAVLQKECGEIAK